ncbi:MAG TPA: DNA alkylation repair protein [Anaerolineae bacterium]|nr:DNA alkylation repair protein [Anaerolineae bacterium]
MDLRTERQSLLEQIEARADPHYQGVIQRSIPSPLQVYGLCVWQIRQIVRAWRREHRDVAMDHLLALVEAFWAGESREERLIALELPQHYPLVIPQLTWEHFDRWRRNLDNWELTDVLGVGVLGPWVAASMERREQHLWDLVQDEDIWSRRLGLVSIVGLNRARANVDLLPLALGLVDQVKDAPDHTITRAISWVLRELGQERPGEVAAYLEENVDLLPKQVLREVTNKLTTGRKDGRGKK